MQASDKPCHAKTLDVTRASSVQETDDSATSSPQTSLSHNTFACEPTDAVLCFPVTVQQQHEAPYRIRSVPMSDVSPEPSIMSAHLSPSMHPRDAGIAVYPFSVYSNHSSEVGGDYYKGVERTGSQARRGHCHPCRSVCCRSSGNGASFWRIMNVATLFLNLMLVFFILFAPQEIKARTIFVYLGVYAGFFVFLAFILILLDAFLACSHHPV